MNPKHDNIYIEVKNHSVSNGKVRTAEVDKFVRDLCSLSASGIFVSLHSGIVGKHNFQLDRLPNGRYAVYISYNNYDPIIIGEIVRLLNYIESMTSTEDFTLSAESIMNLNDFIQELSRDIHRIKNNLTESVRIIDRMKFRAIDNILKNNNAGDDELVFECDKCSKTFKSSSGLTRHKNKCT